MNKYSFESEFTENQGNVLRVNCESFDGEYYDVLIDTYDDPYKIYYCEGAYPKDNEKFRDELFAYLKKKYPEHF